MYLFNTLNHKSRTFLLLSASALGSLVLATPAMAEDFTITSGTTTNNGNTLDGGDTVTVTGALVTSGVNNGIDTTAGSNKITVSTEGSITTANLDHVSGINNVGSFNTTTVSGSVMTNGNYGPGIANTGNSNINIVSGQITAKGVNAHAIYNNGHSNTNTVLGSLTTTQTGGVGIHNLGNSNINHLSGNVTTSGTTAYGIFNEGNKNTTTVLGNIITGGSQAYGIANIGDSNNTTMAGSISTKGDSGIGIYHSGHKNTTAITGSITTKGSSGHGVITAGNFNLSNLSGTITIERSGTGMQHVGNNNLVTVSGSITTKGSSGNGIFTIGNKNTTSLSGSIVTTGNTAMGISHIGEGNKATVSGSISTSGTNAFGIYHFSGDNTAIVSGTVKTTGLSAPAFFNGSGSGNSFTLNEGATIIGDILADDDATNSKLVFNLAGSSSYAYSVSGKGEGTGTGQWTFSDLDGRTAKVTTGGTGCDTTVTGANNTVCNFVTAVGSGNAMEHNELQLAMNASLMGSLQSGSSQANNLTEAMASPQASKSNTWVNVYGASSKRASSTTQSAFDTSNAGLSIGIPMAISDRVYMDLVFNTSKTNLDIGLTKDQEITAQAYNLGAVVRDFVASDTWSVDAFGFIGRNAYDGKRKVMNNQQATGSESVTAAYSGMAVLVGVDAQFSNPINNTLSFIGGVNASLSNEKIGAYSESKYFAWDARTMTQTTGGITTGLEYHTDALTTFASLGAQRSSLRSGKTAGYTNNSTAGSYTDSATGDTYRTASIGFDYAAAGGMSVTGAVERLSSTSGVSGNSTSLSVNRTF